MRTYESKHKKTKSCAFCAHLQISLQKRCVRELVVVWYQQCDTMRPCNAEMQRCINLFFDLQQNRSYFLFGFLSFSTRHHLSLLFSHFYLLNACDYFEVLTLPCAMILYCFIYFRTFSRPSPFCACIDKSKLLSPLMQTQKLKQKKFKNLRLFSEMQDDAPLRAHARLSPHVCVCIF